MRACSRCYRLPFRTTYHLWLSHELITHGARAQKTDAGVKSPHLHGLLADIYEQEGTEETINEAINVIQHLRDDLDVIRAKYWEGRLKIATRRLEYIVC